MIEKVRAKFERLSQVLDERSRRVWATVEAEFLGYGGQSIVAKATGLSRTTLHGEKGEKDQAQQVSHKGRIRKAGGGRKKLTQQEPRLLSALEALVEPTTRGDPEGALRWTCRSTRQLAKSLEAQGFRIGHQTVASLLDGLGYSLQGNKKNKDGSSHPDRDAQFKYIHGRVEEFQRQGQPVVSVDTKKKELVGDFKNGGREWRPKGNPEQVRVYDLWTSRWGKLIPMACTI